MNYARGYRLWPPKFGATRHAGFGVVVPTEGLLDPVTGDTYELGVKTEGKGYRGSFIGYFTDFDNFQVTVPGTFNGSTWYDWDNDFVRDADETVYVIKSTGDAYVYGTELEGSVRLNLISSRIPENWFLRSGFAWNIGEDKETNDPIRHTQPARGLLALKWEDSDKERNLWFEISADFVSKFCRVPPDRLVNDVGYRSDPQDKTSPLIRRDGLPGYSVFDLHGGINLSQKAILTLGLENLTNKKYRRAHSRWDEIGTNFIVGLSVNY